MKFKEVLAKIAPTLGLAFGGPIGGALGLVAKTLLNKDTATEDELSTALANATPEQLLALKKADQDFAVQMKELGIKLEELGAADRASARELFKVNIWPQIILSGTFMLAYFGLLYLVVRGYVVKDLDANWMGVLTTIVGVLTASIPQILGFWFGSSSGSQEKSAMLAASKPADTP